jgi:hypothetical protein
MTKAPKQGAFVVFCISVVGQRAAGAFSMRDLLLAEDFDDL